MQPGAAAMLRGARARPCSGRASSGSMMSSSGRTRALPASQGGRTSLSSSSPSVRPSSQAARPCVTLSAAPEVYLPLPSDVVAQGAEAVDRHLRSAARLAGNRSSSSSSPHPQPTAPAFSGVRVGVWWGDAEPFSPGCYELGAAVAAVEAAACLGLKARVELHFHGGYSWEQARGDEEEEEDAGDAQGAAPDHRRRAQQASGDGGDGSGDSSSSGRRHGRRRRRRQYHPLPAWVRAVGAANPDIYFRDAHGGTSERECLTLGIDDVPALAGRTAAEAYAGLARALSSALAARGLWGTAVQDVVVGLGPGGELRYPSHPADGDAGAAAPPPRWAYPCVGEFQCYDRYLMASLSAAARERGQPHWGAAGPHDAVGGYGAPSPAQLGFFHPQGGSWSSEYGAFFLEWYGRQLVGHACRVLDAVAAGLASGGGGGDGGSGYGGSPLAPPPRLHARLPAVHWWHGSPERSAELTAGYCSAPGAGEPYLDAMLALARRGVGAELAVVAPTSCCGGGGGAGAAAAAAWEVAWGSSTAVGGGGGGSSAGGHRHPHPHAAADDAWGLLLQQRGTAAAVGVPSLTLVARPRGLGAGAGPGGALGEAEAGAALAALAEAAATGGAQADYRGVELVLPDAVSVDGAFADLWVDVEAEAEAEEEQVVVEQEAASAAALAAAAAAWSAAAAAAPPPPLPPADEALMTLSPLALADEEEDPAAYYGVAAHQARNAYGVPAELIAQHRAALEQRRRQQQQQEQRQHAPAPALRV